MNPYLASVTLMMILTLSILCIPLSIVLDCNQTAMTIAMIIFMIPKANKVLQFPRYKYRSTVL